MSSGRVSITGGHDNSVILSSYELYLPEYQNWTAAASMNTPRARLRATMLTMNNVDLVNTLQSYEIFDFNLQTWSLVENMINPRKLGSLVSLMSTSSSLLITDETKTTSLTFSWSELYHSITNTITQPSSMTYQRFAHFNNSVYYQSTPLVLVTSGFKA